MSFCLTSDLQTVRSLPSFSDPMKHNAMKFITTFNNAIIGAALNEFDRIRAFIYT